VPQIRYEHVVDAGNGSGRFRPNRTCYAPMPDLSDVRCGYGWTGLGAERQ
jgi:hypothetical protein